MDTAGRDAVSNPEGETTRGKLSLDEAVKTAVQSLQESDTQAVPNADADAEHVDEAEDEAHEASADVDGGDPDPDADKDAKDADKAETPAKSEESDSEKAGQDASEAASSTLDAPARWPKDRKEQFDKLPDDAKKIVLEREAEFNKGFTEYAQKVQGEVKLAQTVRESFTDDHREQMRTSGLDEAGAVRELVKLHDYYHRDPVSYVKAAIKHRQLTPEQVFPELFGGDAPDQQEGEASAPDHPQHDPALQTVQQDVGSIKRFLSDQIRQQQLSFVEQTINRLADEKDEGGNPKHPHFDEVIDDVMSLLERDKRTTSGDIGQLDEVLREAYETAVYRRPDLRQQIIDSEVQSRLAAETKTAEADKARKAATRKGSPGSSTGKARKGKMSLDEAVRAAVNTGGSIA